jgi:hypothetical protein
MLLLGHAGITLGAAALLSRTSTRSDPAIVKQYDMEEHLDNSADVLTQRFTSTNTTSRLVYVVKQIDVRLLLIGSLLPDIIDKPIGLYFLRDTFSSGRIFCHAALFLILITIAGVHLYRRRSKVWLLVISFGTLTHLLLDQMWLIPRTFMWPLYGFRFEPEDVSEWKLKMLHELLADPSVFVPELVGAFILAWFIRMLVHDSKVYTFMSNGRVL